MDSSLYFRCHLNVVNLVNVVKFVENFISYRDNERTNRDLFSGKQP